MKHVLQATDLQFLLQANGHKSEYLRSWAIQLDAQDGSAEELESWVQLAKSDASPLVRLYLASALQRLPLNDRWEIAEHLTLHADDAADQNLPLLTWYGVEPLVPHDVNRALKLAKRSRIPLLREYIYRRAAAEKSTIGPLLVALKGIEDVSSQKLIVGEVTKALSREGKLEMPSEWPAVSAMLAKSSDAQLREQSLALSVKFGDASIFPALRSILQDGNAKLDSRRKFGGNTTHL